VQIDVPKPTIARLCLLYRLLEEIEREGAATVSSSQLGERLSMNSHNLRKDIGYVGEVGNLGAGYEVSRLKAAIAAKLGLDQQRSACVVGLGELGRAILNYAQLHPGGYAVVAGFDSNINKIETMRTSVSLYPAYQISEIVKRLHIELAVIAVPMTAAQRVADQLVEGGVRGLVNLTPAIIKSVRDDVFVSNFSVTGEFHFLSSLMTLNNHHN
jgi:redox-sensing transcriptional repressor